MSAMKPDGYEFDGWTWAIIDRVPMEYRDRVSPYFKLATVRKWLEELSETVIAAGTIYDMKDDLSDIGADAEGIFRAMLAAKLREIENDT